MKIVVLSGGNSTERDVSIKTGYEVSKALMSLGHDIIFLDCIEDVDNCYHEDLSIIRDKMLKNTKELKNMKHKSFFGKGVLKCCQESDMVFLALHGASGEDGHIQAVFDLLGIPYTGSSMLGSVLGMNKYLTKLILKDNNILTAPFIKIDKDSLIPKLEKFPVVIKPSNGGSSIGVSIVNSQLELESKVKECFKYDDTIIVEEYLKGREFSVGIVSDKVLPIIEIIPKKGFYDYENKYVKGKTIEVCPADIDLDLKLKIEDSAKKAIKSLKIDSYARVDFIVVDNDVYCLEVNTLPGMTDTSLLPQEAKSMGITYEDLCMMIINNNIF